MFKKLGGVLVAWAFITACATTGGEQGGTVLSPTPEMQQGFEKAERIYFAKRFSEASTLYSNYIKEYPYNTLTPKAYFRLGEISYRGEQCPEAIGYFRRSVGRGKFPAWGGYAIYKEAICDTKIGKPEKAFSALDRLPLDQTEVTILIRAGSLRVETAKKVADLLEERKGYLEVMDGYERLNPSDAAIQDQQWIVSEQQAKQEIEGWIKKDDVENLNRYKSWVSRFEGRSAGGYLTWKLARLYNQKGDYRSASEWAQKYINSYPKHPYVADARLLLSQTEKRGVGEVSGERPSIGVLLPLSGKYAVYGESVLHGIECAAGIFEPCTGAEGINLVVRDTQGDPQKAAKIVEEMAQDQQVRAVIGPLPQVEVDAATATAENQAIPMVTLSQKADVAKVGDYIFRNFLTVSDQVSTLVEYACGQKKWKKYAILYPEGTAGEEYRKEFEKEVDHCGGKLIGAASYPPDSNDLTDALRTVKFGGSEQNVVDENVPFDALFVPDVYRRVPAVIRALQTLNLQGVKLLGGAGWNHPSLLKMGNELEGAVFVDGFFAQSSNPATRDFVSVFQSAYGVEPTLLEAYAYDTMRLLGDTLRLHPTADRVQVQKNLAQLNRFSGVTGNISFDDEGDAHRRLSILTIEHGAIEEVR